jgi:hypothetical protein
VPANRSDGRPGITVHEERLNRAYHSGGVGFLERWAQQKCLNAKDKSGRLAGLLEPFSAVNTFGQIGCSKESSGNYER